MRDELSAHVPALLRPVTDREARLGAGMIAHLADLGDAGMDDATGEVAMAVMLALYAEHRREMRDDRSLDRLFDSARRLYASGQFRMLTGDAYAKHVADEMGAGRLKA